MATTGKITRQILRDAAKTMRMSYRCRDGEHRVNLRKEHGGSEMTAMYTNDAQDALGSMSLMAKVRDERMNANADVAAIRGIIAQIELDDDMHTKLMAKVDILCREFGLGYDDLFNEFSKVMFKQITTAGDDLHPAVKGCLEGAGEALRHASFCYYASFK